MVHAPARRLPLAKVAAFLLLLGCAAVAGLAAQPPQEVEDPNGRVKKKIVVDDDAVVLPKGATATPTGSSPDVRLDELARAADEARVPALQAVLAKHTVPFDLIVLTGGGTLRVQPVPVFKTEWPRGPDAGAEVRVIDEAGKIRETRRVNVVDIRSIEHFEHLVLAEADKLIKQKVEAALVAEYTATAEKLFAAGLRYHDYAKEVKQRRGKGWDDTREPLATRLRGVRLDLLRGAIAAGDALRVRDVSTRLMNAYPNDSGVAQAVAVARVGEAERLLASGTHLDHLRAKELLDEFESRFPGANNDAVKKTRTLIKEIASRAFTRAKEKKAVGDLTTARDELARASALDPTVEGLRDMQRELRTGYPILYVGVRQFPETMSPVTAKLDSEKQAVELIFEGLLEEVPDDNGSVLYRPGGALEMPLAVTGGRDFLLRTFEREANGRPGFDSHDVVGTVKLLSERADTWQAYSYAWLGGLPTPRDSNAIRVPMTQGHPDPRAMLTFKLHPARWMTETNKKIDDLNFAEKPIGTGPFRLEGSTRPTGNTPREMVFVDNAGYGRWRDRTGLPNLREVRFIEVTRIDTNSKAVVQVLDPVEAFRTDKLHVLTDIPTADLDKFNGTASPIANRVQVVTSSSNRRVHMLAVNLTRPHMQSKALRQGLSMAIDREEVLRDVFRAGRAEFHRAMTGPYPPNSWATPKGAAGSLPLVNRDLATARFKAYMQDASAKLDIELIYPMDDPKAEEACKKIKAQVDGLTKDAPGGRRIVLNLVGIPMRDLLVRVTEEHNRYDLAYVPFDFPDDWHPFALGAMLDPLAAGRGGRNWFGFLTPETNPDAEDLALKQTLLELRNYRDVAGQLAPKAALAAKAFNDSLPFIPLWQLDRHTVIHNALKVFVDDTALPADRRLLNPTPLFQGVARWRLE